jgi:uncharacterized Zn finger protein
VKRLLLDTDVAVWLLLAETAEANDELHASCTCPDEANPCKHTAAVY